MVEIERAVCLALVWGVCGWIAEERREKKKNAILNNTVVSFLK